MSITPINSSSSVSQVNSVTFPKAEQALFDLLIISPRDRVLLKSPAFYDCDGDVLQYARGILLGGLASELQTLAQDQLQD